MARKRFGQHFLHERGVIDRIVSMLAPATDDALVEIGSAENATSIYRHFTALGVRFLLQKKAWRTVKAVDDMPFSYKEGSVFLSCEKEMPWR